MRAATQAVVPLILAVTPLALAQAPGDAAPAGEEPTAGAAEPAATDPQVERAVRADGRPAPLKVIVRRPCAIRLEPHSNAGLRREASPMEFFFVLPGPDGGDHRIDPSDGGWWYRIATREVVRAGETFGYVHSSDVTEWWHRQAVGFLPRGNGRQRVRFYADPLQWQGGFTRFPDDASADQAARAIEPERLGNQGFVMPVLETHEGVTLELDGSVHDLYRVAFVAAPGAAAEASPQGPRGDGPVAAAVGDFKVDIVFCVDGSGSMQPYIDAVREGIARVATALRDEHSDLQDRFRFGLVTFRGQGEAGVACTLAAGRDHEEFLARVAALDDAGGGDEGEDVLAGLSLAVNDMDWCDVGFKQVVLVGDEAAYGPGNHPEWNSTGLTIEELLAQAQPVEGTVSPYEALRLCRIISTVEIQREVNGEALDGLRTQQFSRLAGLGEVAQYPGEAFRFGAGDVRQMVDAVVADLQDRIAGARTVAGLIEAGDEALPEGRLEDDARWQTVPAPFREMVEMLRPADDGAPGLLAMQEGWISNFDAYGAATVTERFLVTRSRLRRLQQVLESVGLELDRPDVNPAVLVQMLQQRLAAMSIDHDIAPSTPIKEVFEIVGGLPIRTPLMEMTAEQVASMTPADRRRVVDKLQQMARVLEEQVDRPELWFKLDESDDDRDALAFVSINDFR